MKTRLSAPGLEYNIIMRQSSFASKKKKSLGIDAYISWSVNALSFNTTAVSVPRGLSANVEYVSDLRALSLSLSPTSSVCTHTYTRTDVPLSVDIYICKQIAIHFCWWPAMACAETRNNWCRPITYTLRHPDPRGWPWRQGGWLTRAATYVLGVRGQGVWGTGRNLYSQVQMTGRNGVQPH